MKIRNAMVTLSLSVILLCACNTVGETEVRETVPKERKEKVSLSLYYASDDSNEMEAIEKVCEGFMAANDSIEIIMEPSEKGIYTETLKIKEALNEVPDICQIENPYTYVKAGKLGAIPEEAGALLKNPVRVNGKIYSLPMYTTTYGMIYNKVLFHKYNLEIPTTYDEFLKVCRVLKENGVTPLALGGSKSDKLSYWFNYFYIIDMQSKYPNWQEMRSRGEVSFSDDAFKQVLKDYTELLKSDYILEDSINMNDNQIVSNLIHGNAAMVYTGPWMFSQIVSADESVTDYYDPTTSTNIKDGVYRIGWFFMPDREGNAVAPEINTMQWCISKDCEMDKDKLEAATRFLKYYYEKANYRSSLKAVNALQTTKEAVLYPMIGVQQKLIVSYRYAENETEYFGNYSTPEDFKTTLNSTLNSLLSNVISIDTAAARLDEEWDTLEE